MAATAQQFRSNGVMECWSIGHEKSSCSFVLFQYSITPILQRLTPTLESNRETCDVFLR